MENIVENLKNKNEKEKAKLKKKPGLEKLAITLILMAVGVGLCVIFRNQLSSMITTAFTTINTQMTELMSGTISK